MCEDRKDDDMRKKIWIGVCLIAVFFVMFPKAGKAVDAYTVDNLNITIHVQEDGKLLVHEEYDLNFNYYRSSFVRNITSTYHIPTTTSQGIIYQDYYFPVRDIEGDRLLSVDRNEDGSVVTMGEKNKQLTGQQKFSISYTVQTSDLHMPDNSQMLYWTLITNLDTKVEHMHYEIYMPKAFDPQEVYANTGKYGDSKNTLSTQINGNVISGDLLQPLEKNEMATIKVNLPNSYFTFPQPVDGNITASLFSILLLLVVSLVFWRFGREQEIFIDVQTEVPKEINSSEIGYIMNRFSSNDDLLSMFIDWGNRGFLRIHDHGENFELEKLREMNDLNAKPYEKELFDTIFQNNTTVDQDELREARVAFALDKSRHLLDRSFTKKNGRQVYTDSSLILQAAMVIVTLLPSLFFVWVMTYTRFELWELSLRNMIPSFLLGLDLIGWVYLMRHRFTFNIKQFSIRMTILIVVAFILLSFNSVTLYLYGIQKWSLVVYLFVSVALFFCMLFMDKRTRKGNEWKAEILGIREFVESVEPEQLNKLFQQNPKLFQEFLPYAYVLELADIWAKKFEHIPVQQLDWYDGMHEYDHFDTFLFWHTFYYCFYYMKQNTMYRPPIKEAGFFHFSLRSLLPKRKK